MKRKTSQNQKRWLVTLSALGVSLACATVALADYPSVTQQRLDNAHQSTDWLTYYHSYGGESYSPAKQIDRANVKNLQMVWSHKFPADLTQGFEATPIVNGQYMFVTTPKDHVYAFEATTGKKLWSYDPRLPQIAYKTVCCDVVNRGVALYGDNLFVAMLSGEVVSFDAQSGQIVDVNRFMIELLSYTREQYLGKTLWEIGPFKDTAAAKAAFAELQKKKYVHYEDLPLRTADGRDINVEFVSHVYRVNGGEVIQCNIRDISERKRAEEDFRRLNWALRALSQSNSALVHAGTEKKLFQSCCDAIAGAGGYPLAWIGLAQDDPAHSIEIIAVAGEATK